MTSITSLKKTSVQLDPDVSDKIMSLYPHLSISEIIRLSMEYVLECKPKVVEIRAKFVKGEMNHVS